MIDESLILDFDDREVKRKLMSKIGTLHGIWEVSFKKRRETRSLTANSYYWAAVVKPFTDWIREEWGENVSTDQAHEMLKREILGQQESHGIAIPPSTRKMTVQAFSEYVEMCSAWLANKCGIEVVSSDLYFGDEGNKNGKKNQ